MLKVSLLLKHYSAYHILATGGVWKDLGPDHFNQLDPKGLTRYLVKRLEKLGHKVTLEPFPEAA